MAIKNRLAKLERANQAQQEDTWLVVVRGEDPTPTERYSVPKLIPGWGGKTEPVKHEYWNRVTQAWQATKPEES